MLHSAFGLNLPFFYGWVIVGLAFLSAFAGVGVIARSFPVILKPLTEDLGVPRTIGVLGLTVASIASGAAAPFIGRIVDRSGPRLLMVASAALIGGALMALSQVDNILLFLLFFGVVAGVARPSLQAVGAQATVAKWFARRRGRAVTYSTLGMPLSAVVLIPLSQWLVSSYGWRTAWLALGLGVWLVLMAPAALLMRARPEAMGLLPDGERNELRAPGNESGSRTSSIGTATSEDWKAGDAFRSRAFWMLTLAFAAIGLVPSVLNLHMFPHFTDQGLDPATAAVANGSYGLAVILSRVLFWGFFLDRADIRVTLCIWGLLMTGAIATMLLVNTTVLAFMAACGFGLAMGGTAPLETMAWARYFGRSYLATITGLAHSLGTAGSVAGPLFGSLVYDATGSYAVAFVATSVVCLGGVAMIVLAGPPRRPPAPGRMEPVREEVHA